MGIIPDKKVITLKKRVGAKKGSKLYIPCPKPKSDLKTDAGRRLYDSIIFEEELLAIFGIRNSDLLKLRYFREFPYCNITKCFRVYHYDSVVEWIKDNQVKLGFNIPNKEKEK